MVRSMYCESGASHIQLHFLVEDVFLDLQMKRFCKTCRFGQAQAVTLKTPFGKARILCVRPHETD